MILKLEFKKSIKVVVLDIELTQWFVHAERDLFGGKNPFQKY
jgi:hypothetical protein